MLKVYIAARGQDQHLASLCRAELAPHGVACTSQWIDKDLAFESHDEAQLDIDDVRAADALIVIKPKDSHRETTGGHHVETGIALERGIPILLLGERENVFHHHDGVRIIPWPVASWSVLADEVTIAVLERRRAAPEAH
jgi:hypothetical protein